MLLTLKPTTAQHSIGGSPHDFSQQQHQQQHQPSHSSSSSSSTSRYPSVLTANPPPPPSTSSSSSSVPGPATLLASDLTQARMATPHRALPPPVGMTLPAPAPSPHAPSMPVERQLMTLPAPPDTWGREENMRNWLQAKSEEDRRKQEEEKTRQESLKLEQRRMEHSILRDSLQGGIPPPMVPIVFAGMAGANIETTMSWAHQYINDINIRNQQEAAMAAQQSGTLPSSNPYINYPPQAQGSTQSALAPAQSQQTPFLPPYQQPSSAPRARSDTGPPPVASAPRTDQGRLPRINTNEMPNTQPIQAPPASQMAGAGQPLHPLQQSQGTPQQQPPTSQPQATSAQAQEQTQSSPNNIFFYHWQPPNSQASGSSNQPTTPSDYTSSPPKKRKMQGSHSLSGQPPTSQASYTSPSFSHPGSAVSTPGPAPARRRGHSRNRSDASSRGYEAHGRPSSRHRTVSSAGQPQGSSTSSPDDVSGNIKRAAADQERRASEQRFSAGPDVRRERDESTQEREQSRLPPFKRDEHRD